ncbi:hypothetical protein [Streptomyces sp. TLI_171]|uniref:hypothetical protein n=1 Tax=Streptomyces sp. TLI_171 TaxID=1938859 RepID=UPI000C174284|nr:hypothetical protein [Streptomyces sp. TLI_171]
MPHALNDPGHPLRAPEAGRLLPPPPPAPPVVGRSNPAIALYTAAGLIVVYWIATVSKGLDAGWATCSAR